MSEIKNIWDQYLFLERSGKSVVLYIKEQAEYLKAATRCVLDMEVEVKYTNSKSDKTIVNTYDVYILCPRLGNYRKKILTINETNLTSYFPIEIISNIDYFCIKDITEETFLEDFTEILSRDNIKQLIEHLYQMSIERDLKNN